MVNHSRGHDLTELSAQLRWCSLANPEVSLHPGADQSQGAAPAGAQMAGRVSRTK